MTRLICPDTLCPPPYTETVQMAAPITVQPATLPKNFPLESFYPLVGRFHPTLPNKSLAAVQNQVLLSVYKEDIQ